MNDTPQPPMKQPDPWMPPDLQRRLDACADAHWAELATTWRLAALGRMVEPAPVDEAPWEALNLALHRTDTAPTNRRGRTAIRHRAWPRQAVGWLVGATLAVVLLAVWLQPVTVSVPRGATTTFTLPDGSTAELNSGTQLTYRRAFVGFRRVVRLEGEAFFDVKAGRRPFIVETYNAAVRVHGTRFNVRAWPDAEDATEVVLASGAVELISRAAGQSVKLAPGERSRVSGRTAPPVEPEGVLVDRTLAWRDGGLAFYDVPLRAIAAEVERKYNVAFYLTSQDVADDHLVFYLNQPGGVADVIAALRGFGYECRSIPGGYEIAAPGTP